MLGCDKIGVPGWLLKIVMGFLSERSIILRHNGASSSVKSLPGGGPQGTILGMFLFLILINCAGFEGTTKSQYPQLSARWLAKENPLTKLMKYVDDFSILEAVNMNDLNKSYPRTNLKLL